MLTHTREESFTNKECRTYGTYVFVCRKEAVYLYENYIYQKYGKGFSDSGDLKRHISTQTGKKPHICHKCGIGFSCSGHLKGHLIETPNREKPKEGRPCVLRTFSDE